MSEPMNPFEPLIEAIVESVVKKLATSNEHPEPEERLLSAEQAAQMMGVSPDWLYRQAKKLPFTRKLGPKMLRFSYLGMLKWLATRKPC